jgi:hypothetical protein
MAGCHCQQREVSGMSNLINLDDIEKSFSGTNFGDLINSNRDEKLKYTLKALEERLYGYHTGWTITQIMIEMELLTPKSHKVSKKGLKVLRIARREKEADNDWRS